MAIDDSFTKPGSVPFKWEIRPGVPKIQHPQQKLNQTPQPLPSPDAVEFDNHRSSLPAPPRKLKPPPAGLQFFQPVEPRSQSFRSAPRTRSERWRFEKPGLRPEYVLPGCFPTPSLRGKGSKRRVLVPRPESEPGYSPKLETLSRWSVSSRKSLSPFTASPASPSFSSYKFSPQPVVDAEWAGFGLF